MPYESLDIDKVYHYYDKGDLQEVASLVDTAYNETYYYLDEMGQIWEECVYFYDGDHYIYYNTTSKRYETIPITKFNKFIPRPKTNFIFPIVNTVTSLLTRNKPQVSVWSDSRYNEDVNKAKVSDAVLDAKWELDTEALNHVLAAKILVIFGHVYRKDYWDTSGVLVAPGIDDKGKRIDIPMGDTAVAIRTPYEVMGDLNSRNLDKSSFVFEGTVQKISWIKSTYDQKGLGYTGLVEQVRPSSELSQMLSYVERLKASTGNSGQYSEAPKLKDSITHIECYIEPNRKHPKGLHIAVADKTPLYIYDSKYTDNEGKEWHPFSECKYEIHPVRHHGIGLVQQIVPLQRRLNAIDTLIILNRTQMASPQWLIPEECKVPRGFLTGAPGLNITYKSLGGTIRPHKVRGESLDASVYRERDAVIQEMHRLAGDNEVLSGVRPQGVDTMGALNMLLEQSFNTKSNTIQAWEKFIERSQTKKINLIKSMYKEPRPQLIEKMRQMNRCNYQVQIEDFFIGEKLGDNLNVKVEAGSSIPRSRVAEQMNLKELAGSGVLGPLDPMQNPEGAREFLSRFGLNKFPTAINADVELQKWELDVMRHDDSDEIVQVREFHEHSIHLKVVTDEMKKPGFYQSDPRYIARVEKHKSGHEEALELLMQTSPASPQPEDSLPGATAELPPQPAGGMMSGENTQPVNEAGAPQI